MYKQYYRVDHLLSMGKILEALWSNIEVWKSRKIGLGERRSQFFWGLLDEIYWFPGSKWIWEWSGQLGIYGVKKVDHLPRIILVYTVYMLYARAHARTQDPKCERETLSI